MLEEFNAIQQMVSNNTSYMEREGKAVEIARRLPASVIADLIRQLSGWKKTLDEEYQKEQSQKLEGMISSNMLRGPVDPSFADFQSEQRDNEFRGDAQMHSEKMEKIDLIIVILQRGKSE